MIKPIQVAVSFKFFFKYLQCVKGMGIIESRQGEFSHMRKREVFEVSGLLTYSAVHDRKKDALTVLKSAS